MGLPVKGRALEPEWNWSGFYAGLNAGYARGNTIWSDLDAVFTAGGSIINESNNAFTGGGQIGYNWQFRRAVVGLETDFNYLGLNQSTSLFAVAPGAVPITFHDSVHWLGTVRGRAGLAVDNVMTYITAGLAYAKTNHNFNDAGLVNHEIGTTKVGFAAGFRRGICARSALVGQSRSALRRSRKEDDFCPRSAGRRIRDVRWSLRDRGHDVDRPRRGELQVRRLNASAAQTLPSRLKCGPDRAGLDQDPLTRNDAG